MTDEIAQLAGSRNIFVVHGRNETLRRSMFDFLRSIGLRPLEWSTALSLTGQGAPYIGDVLDAAFAEAAAVVVLLTPDEFAYLRDDLGYAGEPDTKPQLQPRPNVLFEAGMALGRHPANTILVEIGKLRSFSDVAGRHVVRLTNDLVSRQELANRLQTAGCDVELQGTDWHSAGDFSSPSPPPVNAQATPQPNEPKKAKEAREELTFQCSFPTRLINTGKVVINNTGDLDFQNVVVVVPKTSALRFEIGNSATDVSIPIIPAKRAVTLPVTRLYSLKGIEANAFFARVHAERSDGAKVAGQVFWDLNSNI